MHVEKVLTKNTIELRSSKYVLVGKKEISVLPLFDQMLNFYKVLDLNVLHDPIDIYA